MSHIHCTTMLRFCPEIFPGKDLLIEMLPPYQPDPEDEPITPEVLGALEETMKLYQTIVTHLYEHEIRMIDSDSYIVMDEMITPKQRDKREFIKFVVNYVIHAWNTFKFDAGYRRDFFNGIENMVQNFEAIYRL